MEDTPEGRDQKLANGSIARRMVLLPIVGKELRVAACKRSTFWVRVVAAMDSLVIGG